MKKNNIILTQYQKIQIIVLSLADVGIQGHYCEGLSHFNKSVFYTSEQEKRQICCYYHE